jgi:hypothetical protein
MNSGDFIFIKKSFRDFQPQRRRRLRRFWRRASDFEQAELGFTPNALQLPTAVPCKVAHYTANESGVQSAESEVKAKRL